MEVMLEPGIYVVAVSGGVDSMVLLHALRKYVGVKLVVAHFEHGIRTDSDSDRQLVQRVAKDYGLSFMYEHGAMGIGASESRARHARYTFLRRIMRQVGARSIITGHHQDDLIETAVINIIRGTGRKGLSSMGSADVIRPLLGMSKQEILAYAVAHNVIWHEDSTNQNDSYLRNYIRHTIIPMLGQAGRRQLLMHIERAQQINPAIDDLLLKGLHAHIHEGALSRRWFTALPYDVSRESMATWLRSSGVREFDRRTIERLVVAAKVAQPGKYIDVNAATLLKVGRVTLQLSARNTS